MAEGVLNKIILWGLLILFMLVFLFAIYSKTGFMSKIANLALGAERFLPVEPNKEVKQDESLPQLAINAQKAFMDDLTNYIDKEKCLLTFRGLGGLDDYKMEVSNFENKVVSRIILPDGRLGSPSETKEGIQICVVDPEAFFGCYLSTQIYRDCSRQLYRTLDSVYLTKDNILLYGANYELSQNLFKPAKDKVCLIQLYVLPSSAISGCYVFKDAITYECLDRIKEIPLCSK